VDELKSICFHRTRLLYHYISGVYIILSYFGFAKYCLVVLLLSFDCSIINIQRY